jgi:hypothetical protein
VEVDVEARFRFTLLRGLEAALVREPGAVGGKDLGLGTSPSVVEILGVAGQDPQAVHAR